MPADDTNVTEDSIDIHNFLTPAQVAESIACRAFFASNPQVIVCVEVVRKHSSSFFAMAGERGVLSCIRNADTYTHIHARTRQHTQTHSHTSTHTHTQKREEKKKKKRRQDGKKGY